MSKPDTVPETTPADVADEPMQNPEDKASAEEEEEKVVPIQPKPKRVPFERREEVYLRKRKDRREKKMKWLENRKKRRIKKSKNQLKIQLKTLNFKSPFKDINKYVRRHRQQIFANRRMRITHKVGHFRYAIPKDAPELMIAVRIKCRRDVHPEFIEVMRKMGLNTMLQGAIVRKTPELCDNLIRLGPYVTFGAPSDEAVRDLLHRRGQHITFVDGKRTRVPLTDNRMIEDELGECDIICVNDLVEEILNVGPHVDKCLKFLGPFRVTPEKGKRWNYKKPFNAGGDWGYRPGNKIMELFI